VGFVTAFGGIKDYGLNQATWETLQRTVTRAEITRLDNIESIDTRDWQKNITFFADNGYDVIVTVGSNMEETMAAVATEYPSVSFIGVDQEYQEGHENIATIDFPEDQAGFLAGILAAMVSQRGKVGAICETSGIDIVWQYCEGFRAGAVHEETEIDVTVVYRNSGDRDKIFNDPEWGEQEMFKLIGEGVDTITGFGGNTAQGAFLTASEHGILVIGSEADLYDRFPNLQPVIVTSIIKDPDIALSSLVLLASQGESISGPHAGQIGYAPFRMSRLATAMEIRSKVEEALQGIRNGEIEISLPEKR
jgi:basic membrane protein A